MTIKDVLEAEAAELELLAKQQREPVERFVAVPPPDEETISIDPQDALRQYVQSEGFRLHLAECRSRWGTAAVLRRIKQDLIDRPASEHSLLTQSTLQIAEEIQKMFAWPEEEYERLRGAGKPPAAVDRFPQYRRTP